MCGDKDAEKEEVTVRTAKLGGQAERGDNGCDHSLREVSGRDLGCACSETLSPS